VTNSRITAAGALTQTATADESISATVFSASAAVAVGVVGVAVSGSGVYATNRISTDVQSYITGSTIVVGSASLVADDTSDIYGFAGSASLAAAFGGVGVAVSIGLAVASNDIGNRVEAYVNTSSVTTTSGDMIVQAVEDAGIDAVSVAASAALSGGIFSVSVSGGGASATNTIQNTTRAYVVQSPLNVHGNLTLEASETDTALAKVDTLSAAVGLISISAGGSVAIGTATPTVEAYTDMRRTSRPAAPCSCRPRPNRESRSRPWG